MCQRFWRAAQIKALEPDAKETRCLCSASPAHPHAVARTPRRRPHDRDAAFRIGPARALRRPQSRCALCGHSMSKQSSNARFAEAKTRRSALHAPRVASWLRTALTADSLRLRCGPMCVRAQGHYHKLARPDIACSHRRVPSTDAHAGAIRPVPPGQLLPRKRPGNKYTLRVTVHGKH